MKKILKKNQVIITSLAVLIAVAGYLNFADVDLGLKNKEMCIRDRHVVVKVQNSYQKSTIAEAVQINDEKDEMEKPHFLAQDPDHGSGHRGILSGICLYIQR